MKPETAETFAAALEQLAALIREHAVEQEALPPRVKLKAASKATGIPTSTLRELCARREITSTKLGRDYMVRLSDIEAYQQRNEVRARGSHLREATAAH